MEEKEEEKEEEGKAEEGGRLREEEGRGENVAGQPTSK